MPPRSARYQRARVATRRTRRPSHSGRRRLLIRRGARIRFASFSKNLHASASGISSPASVSAGPLRLRVGHRCRRVVRLGLQSHGECSGSRAGGVSAACATSEAARGGHCAATTPGTVDPFRPAEPHVDPDETASSASPCGSNPFYAARFVVPRQPSETACSWRSSNAGCGMTERSNWE